MLTDFDPAAEQRLRASRMLELGEWFDDTMLGVPAQTSMPIKTGLPPGSYRAGIAVPYGSLAVVEGTSAGPVFTLVKVGVAPMLQAVQGTETSLDLPLAHEATTDFPVSQLLNGLDAAFGVADIRFDLGLELSNGLVADVARDIGGNTTNVAPEDGQLQLPALTGDLAGHRWVVALGASTTAGGGSEQRVFFALDGLTSPVAPQLPLPTLTAPTDGATVAASGFEVVYTLPDGSAYATIELCTDDEEHRWLVVVPPDLTQFSFWELPSQAQTPLVAGLQYTLTLTAFRLGDSIVGRSQYPYRDLTTFWRSIDASERGVRALARRSVTVTAN